MSGMFSDMFSSFLAIPDADRIKKLLHHVFNFNAAAWFN